MNLFPVFLIDVHERCIIIGFIIGTKNEPESSVLVLILSRGTEFCTGSIGAATGCGIGSGALTLTRVPSVESLKPPSFELEDCTELSELEFAWC